MHTLALGLHVDKLAFAVAHFFHDDAHAVLGHIHDKSVYRLTANTVDLLIYYPRSGNKEFKSVAPHVFHKDGKMHLTAAGYVVGIRAVGFRNTKRHILEGFLEQIVAYMARGDVFTLGTGKRAVVHRKGHFHRRLAYLDKGERFGGVDITDGIAYVDVLHTRNADYVPYHGALTGNAAQSVYLVHGGYAAASGVTSVIIADAYVLLELKGPALYTAYGYFAHIIVVVHRGDQHLRRSVGIALGCGDMGKYHIKQGAQVGARMIRRDRGGAVPARAENDRAVKLVVGGFKLKQKLQHLVADLVNTRVRAVDLIDDHDYTVSQLDGLLEHKARLRHRPLGGVHKQKHAVDHFKYPLDLASEIGMSRRVDYIYLNALIIGRGVFCKYGYAAFALKRVAVHHPLLDHLIVTEQTAEFEHLVHKRGLAVVDVCNNGDVS